MKRRWLFLVIALLAAACGTGGVQDGGSVTVSAAVSLRDAFTEIGDLYKAKTGREAMFNFGASGALQKQIEAGAPVDVFASAGGRQMDELAAKGLVDAATRRDMAANTLVLIVPRDSKLELTGPPDLLNTAVQRIAVGNPATVPAGQYTEQVFTRSGLTANLQPKLVFAENVRQVLDYVSRGEADAGLVYATDAKMAGDTVRVVATAAEGLHDPILYPIAVIRDSKNREPAERFVELVMSEEGQAILRKHGFGGVAAR